MSGDVDTAIGLTPATWTALHELHRDSDWEALKAGIRDVVTAAYRQGSAHAAKVRRLERSTRTEGIPHGTVNGYQNYLCRCGDCRKANAEDQRNYRASYDRQKLRDQERRWVSRNNAETLPGARNHRQQWTGPELEIATRPDLSIKEAAQMLGRSFHAVREVRRRCRKDPRKIDLLGAPRGGGANP